MRQSITECMDPQQTYMQRLSESRMLRIGSLGTTGLLLSGCLISDPPPPPETAPLEVVATSSVKPDEPCLLNRDELGAGTHDVVVISELKPSDIRIRDSVGKVIFEASATPQVYEENPRDLPADQVPPEQFVTLEAGSYTIECEPQGEGTYTAGLTVMPARPGYEDVPAGER